MIADPASEALAHGEDIPVPVAAVGDLVHQRLHKMHAEAADRPRFKVRREIGGRNLERVEGDAVV